jgi:hypothetical protein
VEAEVTECRFVHASAGSRIGDQVLGHYAVGFAYKVDGITYEGVTSSPVEVQRHDKFAIRYNPEHPAENNSLASVCDRAWFKDYQAVVGGLILGLILYGFAQRYIFHH